MTNKDKISTMDLHPQVKNRYLQAPSERSAGKYLSTYDRLIWLQANIDKENPNLKYLISIEILVQEHI